MRAIFEAHGDILTLPASKGDFRDLTNTPGVMERQPAWAPDGEHIAYFSDESGLYALCVAEQNGGGTVKKIPLLDSPTYYFNPKWSPDSKLLAFRDNKLDVLVLNTENGKLTKVDTDVKTLGAAARLRLVSRLQVACLRPNPRESLGRPVLVLSGFRQDNAGIRWHERHVIPGLRS